MPMTGNPFNPFPGRVSKKKPLPEGFEEVFGSKPRWGDFYLGKGKFSISYTQFAVLLVQWQTELKAFRQFGLPDWADMELLGTAREVFEEWGLGVPTTFEDRYGWWGRFVDSELPRHDHGLKTIQLYPDLVVSQYQVKLIMKTGKSPERLHWLVPPGVFAFVYEDPEKEPETAS